MSETTFDAVSYVLQRCKHDANLRWYMLGTEAFARLCAAAAEQLGVGEDDVAREIEVAPLRKPDVVLLRQRLGQIGVLAEGAALASASDARQALAQIAELCQASH